MRWLERLSTSPVLMRDMEARAGRDDDYRPFSYCGPGLFLLILQMPLAYGLVANLMLGDEQVFNRRPAIASGDLFLVTVWMLVLYFAHTAARFCAGSMAIERERGTIDALRLVRAPRDLLAGKYVAALSPLAVEAVAAIAVLSLYAMVGAVAISTVLLVGALFFGLILFFGVCGMYWSVVSRDVMSALSRAFCTVLALNALPMLVGAVLCMYRGDEPDAPRLWGAAAQLSDLSPLYAGTLLLHPWDASIAALGGDLWRLLPPAVIYLLLALLLHRAAVARLEGR